MSASDDDIVGDIGAAASSDGGPVVHDIGRPRPQTTTTSGPLTLFLVVAAVGGLYAQQLIGDHHCFDMDGDCVVGMVLSKWHYYELAHESADISITSMRDFAKRAARTNTEFFGYIQ